MTPTPRAQRLMAAGMRSAADVGTARPRRYTAAQAGFMGAWRRITGLEFLLPGAGETFAQAIERNARRVREIAADAERLAAGFGAEKGKT